MFINVFGMECLNTVRRGGNMKKIATELAANRRKLCFFLVLCLWWDDIL